MTNNNIVWVGMDTDAKRNHVAVYRNRDERPTEFETGMDRQGIQRLIERLKQEKAEVRCVYEAGPCGYELYRQLREAGMKCEVIAPALTPRKPGDRIKTNRRDAQKLGRLHRAGELTVIQVPNRIQEAVRDVTRAREDIREDVTRRQHRLARFLGIHGYHYEGGEKWTATYWRWLRTLRMNDSHLQMVFEEWVRAVEQSQEQLKTFDAKLDEIAQQPEYADKVSRYKTLRGIQTVTAMTIVSEVWDMHAYVKAPQFMASTGLVSSEYSTGEKQRRGSITKAGNAHLRRVLVEAAWHYRHGSKSGPTIQKRRKGQPPEVVAIAERAEQRLNRKFHRLVDRYNKKPVVAAVATARELAGFVWAIGQTLD